MELEHGKNINSLKLVIWQKFKMLISTKVLPLDEQGNDSIIAFHCGHSITLSLITFTSLK